MTLMVFAFTDFCSSICTFFLVHHVLGISWLLRLCKTCSNLLLYLVAVAEKFVILSDRWSTSSLVSVFLLESNYFFRAEYLDEDVFSSYGVSLFYRNIITWSHLIYHGIAVWTEFVFGTKVYSLNYSIKLSLLASRFFKFIVRNLLCAARKGICAVAYCIRNWVALEFLVLESSRKVYQLGSLCFGWSLLCTFQLLLLVWEISRNA